MSEGKVQNVLLPDEELELDWIQLQHDFAATRQETTKEKMIRKIKENPLVPLGCLTTATILGFGLYNFRSGDRKRSQMLMRSRVAAQGFTIIALVVGVLSTYK